MFGLGLGLGVGMAPGAVVMGEIRVSIGEGSIQSGTELTANVFNVPGDATVTYQWLDDGVAVSGITSSSHTWFIGSNNVENLSLISAQIIVDGGDPIVSGTRQIVHPTPLVTANPAIIGDPITGTNLTGTPATFSGLDLTVTSFWQVSDDGATGWTDTGDTDTTSPALVAGKFYRFGSRAENSGGSATIVTSAVGPALPAVTTTATASKTDTSITIDVTASEAGTLYYVADASVTEPSSQEVRDLESDLGESFYTGSSAVNAGANQITITGLTETTAIYTHIVLEDSAGNLSPVRTHFETTNAAAPTAPTVTAQAATLDGEDVLITLTDLDKDALDSRLVGVPIGETAPSVAQVLAGDKSDGTDAPITASPAFTVGQTTAAVDLPDDLDATFDFYLVLSNGTAGAVLSLGAVTIDTTTPAPATGPTIVAFGSIGADTPLDGANYVHEFTGLAFGDARANRQLTVVGIGSDADDTMAASTIGGQAVSVITDVGNGRPDMFVISAGVPSGTTGTVRLDFGTDLARGVQFIVINHDTTDTITQLQKVIDATAIPDLTSTVSEGAFLVGAGGAQIGIGSVGENPVVSWTGLTREDNPAEIDLWQPGGGNPIFANFATASSVSAGSRTVNFAIDGVPTSPRIAGLLIEIVGA